jgi:hypothetical protein
MSKREYRAATAAYPIARASYATCLSPSGLVVVPSLRTCLLPMPLDVYSLPKLLGGPLVWLLKWFKQPELDIEIKSKTGFTSAKGFADRTQFDNENICLVDTSEVISHYELTWFFIIDITNNSENTATNIKLVHPLSVMLSSVKPPISYTKPLKSMETLTVTIEYREWMIGIPAEAHAKFTRFPFDFVEVQYKNLLKLLTYSTKYFHTDDVDTRNRYSIINE